VKRIIAIVIGLLFVGAVLLGATAYWFGAQAEKEYRALLQQGSQLGVVKLTTESYQRGLFSSTARTLVAIGEPAAAGGDAGKGATEPVRFTLVHDIKHGPIVLSLAPGEKRPGKLMLGMIVTRVALSPEIQNQVQELLGKPLDLVPLENTTTFYLGGNGESRFVIPAFHQVVGKDEKVTINWDGLTSEVTFTAGFTGMTGKLSAPGLEVVGNDGVFKMKGMASTLDFHEGVAGLFLGKGDFTVAQIELAEQKKEGSERYSLHSFKLESSSQAAGDIVNTSLTMRAERAAAGDTPYGPGVFVLEMRKIDAASLAKLQQLARQAQGQGGQSSQGDQGQLVLAQAMEIFAGLLKKSPEIEINQLSVKTGKGELLGKAKIVFDGNKGVSFDNPLTLLNAVSAQAEASVDEALLMDIVEAIQRSELSGAAGADDGPEDSEEDMRTQAQAMASELLQNLEAQNLIVHANGKYSASASYEPGKVVLNGRPVPLQELMQ
jgi:uncharacterized protein YdgA (DUF945 family)